MNKNNMTSLSRSELVSACGGTASEADSFARDLGQYIGGFYGAYVEHPVLSNLPYFGALFANYCGAVAASK
jgi:hypothetical protein